MLASIKNKKHVPCGLPKHRRPKVLRSHSPSSDGLTSELYGLLSVDMRRGSRSGGRAADAITRLCKCPQEPGSIMKILFRQRDRSGFDPTSRGTIHLVLMHLEDAFMRGAFFGSFRARMAWDWSISRASLANSSGAARSL